MDTTPNMRTPETITEAELEEENERLGIMIMRDFGNKGFSNVELQLSHDYLMWDRWHRPMGCKWNGPSKPVNLIPYAMVIRDPAPDELAPHPISMLGVPQEIQRKRSRDNANAEQSGETRDPKRYSANVYPSRERDQPQAFASPQNSTGKAAQGQAAQGQVTEGQMAQGQTIEENVHRGAVQEPAQEQTITRKVAPPTSAQFDRYIEMTERIKLGAGWIRYHPTEATPTSWGIEKDAVEIAEFLLFLKEQSGAI